METRKIQSVGGGTYTVSLPKEWGKSEGVAPGDVVNIHRHRDGILAIQTRESDSTDHTESTVRIARDETDRLEGVLRAAYAAGIKELTLVADSEFSTAQRRLVEAVAKKLTGVSVVEAAETEITVQVLLNREEVSVSQSVRQLKFIALSMHETAIESLTDDSATHLATRDDQADRLYAMIDRSFRRALWRLDEVDALGYSRPELFERWKTTRELERVADHAEGIATTSPAVDGSVPESALEAVRTFGQEARSIVADGVAVIVGDAGAETAHEALVARDELCASIACLVDDFGATSDAAQLRPVLHRVRRTAEHGGNIAELGLQDAVRHGELTAPKPVDENVR
ncbi:MAG: phosphate uptake regulator PhoU [Euryarchaeota archaeon]|nr:phosphate uptake regulator PhoU [Euryarchaeota archaeon]